MEYKDLRRKISACFVELDNFELVEKIKIINDIKQLLTEKSPFKDEPVDCVIWEKANKIVANDYNPNVVAIPEMKLLELSITQDGYTQPIVVFCDETKKEFIVIDGFHRNLIGRKNKISSNLNGYLPITLIKKTRGAKGDRIASTIRHNRARGKHTIDKMSEVVLALSRRNWNNEKIAKELGMDANEVLRLKQITGLAEMFKDNDFSEAWEPHKRA